MKNKNKKKNRAAGRSRVPKLASGQNLIPRDWMSKPDVRVSGYQTLSAITSSTSVNVQTPFVVALSSFSDNSDLASVYDQYMIQEVEFTFFPVVNVTSPGASNGLFTTVVDYDDAANPAGAGQYLTYENAVTTRGTAIHKRTFVPRVAIGAYTGSAFSGFSNQKVWIDSASTGVLHYGLKTLWTPTSSGTTMDLHVRAKIAWRGRRGL
jgi:hypothetical protein